LEKFVGLDSFLLDHVCYVTPHDTFKFFELYTEDYYNLQLYSQILAFFDLGFPSKQLWLDIQGAKSNWALEAVKTFLARTLLKASLSAVLRRPILLWEISLPRTQLLTYFLASRFLAVPIFGNKVGLGSSYAVNWNEKRLGLAGLPSRDEFSALLVQTMPTNFPTLYLEGFEDFLEKNLSFGKTIPKVLMSATGWYSNENLKFLAAYWGEKRAKLCGSQHGGLYGTAKWMPPERHEVEITDRFFSWGWVSPGEKSIKPVANPKISCLAAKRRNGRSKKHFLLVATSLPRYLYRFHSTPVAELFEEYLAWRNLFLRDLTPANRSNILVRLNPLDYRRDQRERLSDEFPDLRFDDHRVGFLSRLEETQIAIIDNPITTMLESLARDIPTLLFWHPSYWELREEARPFFEKLAEVGIWHSDPRVAARFLNRISGAPGIWWGAPKTRAARGAFVNRFAMGDRQWAKNWWREMQSLRYKKE
jgi:putative transferase (TIGR04331 family)